MFHDTKDLAALLSSRICHDLISPLGAISNGLELLAMSGHEEGPELNLIGQSIASANSMIRFFRVAYGRAAQGSSLAQAEILSVLADYFRDSRVEIHWQPEREVQRRDVKLAFLAIQCLESAMPFGGRIDVSQAKNEWVLAGTSEKLRALPEHWGLLEGQELVSELGAAQVQFGLLATLTQWRRPAISVSLSDDAIIIRL